jgi:nicotinamidase-related amidase
MPDALIVIDQQKAMDHPQWGPRNNPGAEQNIARLVARARLAALPCAARFDAAAIAVPTRRDGAPAAPGWRARRAP